MATAVNYTDLQTRLKAYFPDLPLRVTGVNDAETVEAVKRFQAAKGLTVDGIAGPKTLAALGPTSVPASAAPAQKAGVDYSAVQVALRRVFPELDIRVTGVNDAETVEAVKRFQVAKGLTVDGIVGPKTLTALGLDAQAAALAGSYATSNASQTTLPDKRTPLTADQAASALTAAYKLVTGSKPTKEVLGLLLAQSALETGNWNAIHNFNFGNQKATSSDRFIQYFRCSEIVNNKEVFYDPPSPQCRFAAFQTATDGAMAYIRLLQKRPDWWAGLQSGSADTFVSSLTAKLPYYFTASPSKYLNTTKQLVAQYAALAGQYGAAGVSLLTYLAIGGGTFFLGRKLVGKGRTRRVT